MSIKRIPVEELPKLIAEGHRVIDVRTSAEFNAAHVSGAELYPLDQLNPEKFSTEHETGKPVYILCQSGKRATMAAEKLDTAGLEEVFVVEGGTDAAIQKGLEIERGKGAISIERQVRIAAGSLVLVGTLVGIFVHPGFLAIPAFIGAGLAFAGITDTCGMGMMLAKMPWNR